MTGRFFISDENRSVRFHNSTRRGDRVKSSISAKWKSAGAAACAACLVALLLSGCASASPSEVVSSTLDAVKGQDTETLAKYYTGDSSEISGGGLSELTGEFVSVDNMTEAEKAAYDKLVAKMLDFDYTIEDERIEGDSADVEVSFASYDIGSAFVQSFSSYLGGAVAMAASGASSDDITDGFYRQLSSDLDGLSGKTRTETATITLTKQDGQWKVDTLSEGAIDAVSGGLYTAVEQLGS